MKGEHTSEKVNHIVEANKMVQVTICPPGIAEGIEPNVCRPTGRPGAPECLYRDPIAEQFGVKYEKVIAKRGEGKRYLESKGKRGLKKERGDV